MAFWIVVGLFIVAQNLQVGIYGWSFSRTDSAEPTLDRVLTAFRDPVFLVGLVFLSMATAALRLWLFPSAGVARTHVVTSTAVVLSFAVLALVFGESQGLSRYAGAILCGLGIFLLAR